ncbi:unnamed protein product [marine sediment metagenome]|uniref:Uncharacterized protein n=1 Tax=marine sediment metagenome TaxID=412755 RepID=X1E7R7_9ZZZZ
MVYRSRYLPEVPTPPPLPTTPPPEETPEVTRKAAPLMWLSGENFDIGQRTVSGGHVFDGKHIVKVADMTEAQLNQASKELAYELKREVIEKREYELMMKIALVSDSPDEFIDKVYEEPILTKSECPPFDPLLDDLYDSVEKIIAQIGDWLSSITIDIATKNSVRDIIIGRGGPAILPPTDESPVPTEVDKLKRVIGDIEQHLVPVPGTPPDTEPVKEEWPEDIPVLTDVPGDPVGDEDLANAWVKLHHLQAYLTNLRAYYQPILFNMGWCLEMTRVCLKELKAAKAPGATTDNFKANLDGLSQGTTKLEMGGVFHD